MTPERLVEIFKTYKKAILIGTGIFLVLFITVPLLLSSSQDTTPGKVSALYTHLVNTTALINKEKRYITNSKLENQNANLVLLLSSAASSVKDFQTGPYANVDPDPTLAAANKASLANMQSGLDQALLSNTFERTYRDLLLIEINSLYRESSALTNSTGSKGKTVFGDINSQLKSSYNDLKSVTVN